MLKNLEDFGEFYRISVDTVAVYSIFYHHKLAYLMQV